MVHFRAEAPSRPQPHPRSSAGQQAQGPILAPLLLLGDLAQSAELGQPQADLSVMGKSTSASHSASRASCGTVNVDMEGLYEQGHTGGRVQGLVRAISPQHLLTLLSSQLGGPAGS